MNVLPIEIQNNSVSSTMSMKLTIKIVAFFLGHPVWTETVEEKEEPEELKRNLLAFYT